MYTARNAETETIYPDKVEGLPFQGRVSLKAMLSGENMVMIEMRYPKGASSPEHAHDHESVCYVVSGRVRGVIEGAESILAAGDVCLHPKGVTHSVEALEDSMIVEIKSPAVPLENFLGPR